MFSVATSGTPHSRSIRRRLFQYIGLLMLVSFMLLAAIFYLFSLRPTIDKLAAASLQAVSGQVEIRLRQFFSSIRDSIGEARGLRPRVNLDLRAVGELNVQLA